MILIFEILLIGADNRGNFVVDERLRKAVADPEDVAEKDVFRTGRLYFEMKDFKQCADALKVCKGKKGFFLRCYARFLVKKLSWRSDLIGLMCF